MYLLTIKNARKLLKKGKTYRIGSNALNKLEFVYDHLGFKTKNPKFKVLPPFLKDAKTLYLNGVINWLDVDIEEQKTDFRFSAIHKQKQIPNQFDLSFHYGAFTAWNGEPLWLLDDYETVDQIVEQAKNDAMLPRF
tara:strand:- start:18 stop:425 length:408 start_codon:yes stop_codon:yes gene_type:complete